MRNKSNIDYEYYHLFGNKKLPLNYETHNFTINYIIYMIDSDFMRFFHDYKKFSHESITDVFFERINLNHDEKEIFFQLEFKNLFWLKLNNIKLNEKDYQWLLNFLQLNSRDINRIYLENLELNDNFFTNIQNLTGFETLKFLNFDNNNISNNWLHLLFKFLNKNNIKLEYVSLVSNKIDSITDIIRYFQEISSLRILDISWNHIQEHEIIKLLEKSWSLQEIFCKNIEFTDESLEKIINHFNTIQSEVFHLRISITKKQLKYREIFHSLWVKKNIYFDIDFLDNENKIFTTFYIKWSDDWNLNRIENETFSVLNNSEDFNNMLCDKKKNLMSSINLFLFDFHNYSQINLLLENFSANYIYIENYFISDEDFIYFINSIRSKKPKHYKINFISIEISEFQLNYLIDNFPENITYIEINLNKIINNREKYIAKMLKNKAFIFENMELYQKIFK